MLDVDGSAHGSAAISTPVSVRESATFDLIRLRKRLIRLCHPDNLLNRRLPFEHTAPAVITQGFHAVGDGPCLERVAGLLSDDHTSQILGHHADLKDRAASAVTSL